MSIEASNMTLPPMAKGMPSAESSSRSLASGQPAATVQAPANAADSAGVAEASAEKLQAAVDKLNELMQALAELLGGQFDREAGRQGDGRRNPGSDPPDAHGRGIEARRAHRGHDRAYF
jgi:hypothetical protein